MFFVLTMVDSSAREGSFWAYLVGQDPSDSKSRFAFIHFMYILYIPLK